MNQIDKERYTALKFLADNTRAEIQVYNQKGMSEYRDNVPPHVEDYLVQTNYMDLHGQSMRMITETGLSELHRLEVHRWQYLALVVAGISLAISIWALLKSYGNI